MRIDVEGMAERVRSHLRQSAEITRQVGEELAVPILTAVDLIVETYRAGGKVLLCGNGGSAADCQHMAAELLGRFRREVDRPGLPAIALTTDTSFLTAFANDSGFEGVFERQVRALGAPGDALVGISTSGGSANVLRAVKAARAARMRTIALTGSAGPLAAMADIAIEVPSADTQHVQETHAAVMHAICDVVEQCMFGDRGGDDRA